MPINFRLIHLPWKARPVRQPVDEMEAILPPLAWPNYVLGNHDVQMLASRI
jgi:alpha-glucosidase